MSISTKHFAPDAPVPTAAYRFKGQLSVLLPQPEIDYTVLQERFYMFPRRDGILLGGTFERGVSDPEPNREAEKSVIEAHQRILLRWRAGRAL